METGKGMEVVMELKSSLEGFENMEDHPEVAVCRAMLTHSILNVWQEPTVTLELFVTVNWRIVWSIESWRKKVRWRQTQRSFSCKNCTKNKKLPQREIMDAVVYKRWVLEEVEQFSVTGIRGQEVFNLGPEIRHHLFLLATSVFHKTKHLKKVNFMLTHALKTKSVIVGNTAIGSWGSCIHGQGSEKDVCLCWVCLVQDPSSWNDSAKIRAGLLTWINPI